MSDVGSTVSIGRDSRHFRAVRRLNRWIVATPLAIVFAAVPAFAGDQVQREFRSAGGIVVQPSKGQPYVDGSKGNIRRIEINPRFGRRLTTFLRSDQIRRLPNARQVRGSLVERLGLPKTRWIDGIQVEWTEGDPNRPGSSLSLSHGFREHWQSMPFSRVVRRTMPLGELWVGEAFPHAAFQALLHDVEHVGAREEVVRRLQNMLGAADSGHFTPFEHSEHGDGVLQHAHWVSGLPENPELPQQILDRLAQLGIVPAAQEDAVQLHAVHTPKKVHVLGPDEIHADGPNPRNRLLAFRRVTLEGPHDLRLSTTPALEMTEWLEGRPRVVPFSALASVVLKLDGPMVVGDVRLPPSLAFPPSDPWNGHSLLDESERYLDRATGIAISPRSISAPP